MGGDRPILVDVLRALCDAVRRNQQHLCDLDAVVGDGDHGLTMTRCCQAIEETLPGVSNETPSEILLAVGAAVARSAGGAPGPLLGAAFLEAGRALGAAGASGPMQVAATLEAAAEGIRSRGRVTVGDRTMLDALGPAAQAARSTAERGTDIASVVGAAAGAAEEGARATAHMLARAGRAVRLGQRALGHPDPGAVSVAIMLRAVADRIGGHGPGG